MTKQRGRKSFGDLGAANGLDGRVDRPPHLTDGEAAEWDLIVNSLPSDFFRPGDIPLLGAFCAASALYKEALLMIRKEGLMVDAVDTDYFDEHGGLKSRRYGRRYAHPAKDLIVSQAAAMASLAVKLRLCPSARFNERVAATKANSPAAAARPWEQAGGGDEDEARMGLQ